MKTTAYLVLILCALINSSLFAQHSYSGQNYNYQYNRTKPIIRYSTTHNKMYLLMEKKFSPGQYVLDTLNYDSQLWGTLSTSIIASDFIVKDNGDLVFVKKNGSNIELFSTDFNGQPLWSEVSNGITNGDISKLRLVAKNNAYWMYQDTNIYKFENNTWSYLEAPNNISELKLNSLNYMHIFTYPKEGTNSNSYLKLQYYNGSNWVVRYDTTFNQNSTFSSMFAQFCIKSNDSIVIAYYSFDSGPLGGSHVYYGELHDSVLVNKGAFLGNYEFINAVDMILDLNETPHIALSITELGPHSSVFHTYWNGSALVNSPIKTVVEDYSLHFARPRSMAVDAYNCVHIAYDYLVDYFQFNDSTNVWVKKSCLCEYVNDQNTLTQNGLQLSSNVSVDVNYQWLDCDQNFLAISGANGPTFNASIGGTYALQIEQNGCVDTSACFKVIDLGIKDIKANSYVQLFPNPSSEQFTLTLLDAEMATLEIRDVTGKLILKKENVKSGDVIEVKSFRPGTYFVQVSTAHHQSTISLIKQ